MESGAGYRERGIASWYGSKFHGRRTSSGEPYDMHLATAAHKSLPLPTYAEVTNLDNGRRVIVKINDRGPFKDDRIIDLSYGAALRLDMVRTGTARVEVRVIDVDGGTRTAAAAASGGNAGTWLQAGAYSSIEGARQLLRSLERAKLLPVSIHDVGGLFRVWIGPFADAAEADRVIDRAIELGFDRPHRIKR
jgi:rare lipoprotein A